MSSAISSSLRFLTTKIPISLYPPTTSRTLAIPISSTITFFKRPIFFQRIPTRKPVTALSSPSSSVEIQPSEELPPKLQEIVRLFQSVKDSRTKYEQLMFYGKNLKPLDSRFTTEENKVEGCVSQVWVRTYLDQEKNVVFEADSDTLLTKGLAALLVQRLSGRPVEEVLRVSPDFVVLLGLQQTLTPSRNNGFLNMLKLMQKKALEAFVLAEKGTGSVGSDPIRNPIENLSSRLKLGASNGNRSPGLSTEEGNDDPGSRISKSDFGVLGSRGLRIKEQLERELDPVELKVEDVSYQHAGHGGVKGSDGETHFNLKVVSKEFKGKSLIKSHRLIYDLLQQELQSALHALSVVAKTPAEVAER
ncbi:hypothetical protein HS088_TW19G00028 [Tripterygium wilfordii]|uniref:Fe-S metabolism associated domain-containing protein n=1 Tax=Tripterygium wilfordii TaxID=458696 RepID=A0A7J7C8I2_TRIWF|nr:sufE-like protein 1, chloroplastic/mitochondrial [Tripterygium wilfordii]KAF5730439.1 hypothetical protein HS088_TW19G00028 [Tripterygium wilfordii]